MLVLLAAANLLAVEPPLHLVLLRLDRLLDDDGLHVLLVPLALLLGAPRRALGVKSIFHHVAHQGRVDVLVAQRLEPCAQLSRWRWYVWILW